MTYINLTGGAYVERADDASFGLRGQMGSYVSLGYASTASQYAHAILQLLGDQEVGAIGDSADYIAVTKEHGFYRDGRILDAVHQTGLDKAMAILSDNKEEEAEFHVFKRVATVGPGPKPERPITRYNI